MASGTAMTGSDADQFFGDSAKDCNVVLLSVIRYYILKKSFILDKPVEFIQISDDRRKLNQENQLVILPLDSIAIKGNYSYIEDVSVFLQNNAKQDVSVFRDDKRHLVCIIYSDMADDLLFRNIAMAVPKLMPWVIAPSELDKEDKALLEAVGRQKEDKVFEILDSLYQRVKEHLKTGKLALQFRTLFETGKAQRREKLSNEMSEAKETLAKNLKEADSLIKTIRENEHTLFLLENTPTYSPEIDQLVNLFQSSEELTLNQIQNAILRFTVTVPLDFYDTEQFKIAYFEPNSFVHAKGRNLAELLFAVFVQNRFQINTTASFSYNLIEQTISTELKRVYSEDYLQYAIPQPHHYYAACIGDNERIIKKMLGAGHVCGAILQCVDSVKNLRFTDTPVAKKFVLSLGDNWNTARCILDGEKHLTCREAYDILKGEGYVAPNQINE